MHLIKIYFSMNNALKHKDLGRGTSEDCYSVKWFCTGRVIATLNIFLSHFTSCISFTFINLDKASSVWADFKLPS